MAVGRGGDSTRRALGKLHRVPLSTLRAFVPLEHDPSDARSCRQGGSEWFAHRHGRLTASNFSRVLGFSSEFQRRAVLREFMRDGPPREFHKDNLQGRLSVHDPCTVDLSGSEWGHLYERSALATYLTAFVQPRCAEARLLETGFWPMTDGSTGLSMGASPDALLEGVEATFPGGVVIEAKCPGGGGIPRAQGRVHARQMPQLQGTLLATRRAHCHLVTWSPSAAAIFSVRAHPQYQQAMVGALATATSAARAERRLTSDELLDARRVREWSADLALDATLLLSVDASRCVMLVDDRAIDGRAAPNSGSNGHGGHEEASRPLRVVNVLDTSQPTAAGTAAK